MEKTVECECFHALRNSLCFEKIRWQTGPFFDPQLSLKIRFLRLFLDIYSLLLRHQVWPCFTPHDSIFQQVRLERISSLQSTRATVIRLGQWKSSYVWSDTCGRNFKIIYKLYHIICIVYLKINIKQTHFFVIKSIFSFWEIELVTKQKREKINTTY